MANPILEGWIDPSSNENSDLPLPNEVTCGLHLQALRKYKKDNGLRLPALHRVIVIKTPKDLAPRHLVNCPIDQWKAARLAEDRWKEQELRPTTVFEDPEVFYHYPDLQVIISEEPVTKYRVVPSKSRQDENVPTVLNVHDHGEQFAVFETNFHLCGERDRRLQSRPGCRLML